MAGYDFTNKTPEQLLEDLKTYEVHGSRSGDTFDMAALAIAVHTAKANERAADAAANGSGCRQSPRARVR